MQLGQWWGGITHKNLIEISTAISVKWYLAIYTITFDRKRTDFKYIEGNYSLFVEIEDQSKRAGALANECPVNGGD